MLVAVSVGIKVSVNVGKGVTVAVVFGSSVAVFDPLGEGMPSTSVETSMAVGEAVCVAKGVERGRGDKVPPPIPNHQYAAPRSIKVITRKKGRRSLPREP